MAVVAVVVAVVAVVVAVVVLLLLVVVAAVVVLKVLIYLLCCNFGCCKQGLFREADTRIVLSQLVTSTPLSQKVPHN